MAGTIVANTINTDTGLFSTQNAYQGIAKAWVNFSCPSTTVTINGSFNISSVTRSAAGSYVANFTTAMANANYSAIGNCSSPGSTGQGPALVMYATSYSTAATAPTTSSFVFCTFGTSNGVGQDCTYFTVAVFGN